MTCRPLLALSASLALVFSLMGCAPSFAADPVKPDDHDWPQWRGPNRDGVSLDTGLLKKIPEGGPPFLYSFKGVGDGYCAPAIIGNHAYISGRFDKNEAYLMGFELPKAGTVKPSDGVEMPILGKMLWKTKYGSSCQSGENAAPVVDGDKIIITSGDGDIAAIDTTGKLLWQHNMRKDFGAFIQTNSSYGFSESPLVDGDKVLVCPGTKEAAMVCYNKNTGELIWKAENPEATGPRNAASHASTMISNAGGIKHYVGLTGWGLMGVSPEGKYLWGYRRTCESTIPTPIIKDDYVFAISSYGFGSVLLKLNPDGAGGLTPKVVYSLNSEQSENLCGQAVLIGDKIYVGHGKYAGIPQCIDFLTGKQEWRAKQEGSGVAALIAYENMLIFRNESKELVFIEATPKSYNLVAKFKPISQKNGYAPPVIAHGLLYLRDRDLVMVYDLHQK